MLTSLPVTDLENFLHLTFVAVYMNTHCSNAYLKYNNLIHKITKMSEMNSYGTGQVTTVKATWVSRVTSRPTHDA
jgi:hypothetical protein